MEGRKVVRLPGLSNTEATIAKDFPRTRSRAVVPWSERCAGAR